jgi:hypothetical protein
MYPKLGYLTFKLEISCSLSIVLLEYNREYGSMSLIFEPLWILSRYFRSLDLFNLFIKLFIIFKLVPLEDVWIKCNIYIGLYLYPLLFHLFEKINHALLIGPLGKAE